MGAFKKAMIVAAMLGTVAVIADTIDGNMQILRGIGTFLGSFFGGVAPDVTW